MKKLLSIILFVCCFLIITGCSQNVSNAPVENVIVNYKLDEAVGSAILQENQDSYSSGECNVEGHIILGYVEDSGTTTVYALTMYGYYGFQNGYFTKVSGSGVIPTVFTFKDSENGYICTKVEEPEDGEGYSDSLKKLFPSVYHPRIFAEWKSDSLDLKSQEQAYAASYLKKIGRDAKIGDYGDFGYYTLLTDVGVSVEVDNSTNTLQFCDYPWWIGNREVLENGIRYVYEMSYNDKEHEIVFKKYEYDTNKVIELIRLDSITGSQLPN